MRHNKSSSKYLILVVVCATMLVMALTLPDGLELYPVGNFRGITGRHAIGPSLELLSDLRNAAVMVDNGKILVVKSSGDTVMGQPLSSSLYYPITGIFPYRQVNEQQQIVVAAGNGVLVYDAANNEWVSNTVNQYAGVCSVATGNDTVFGLETSWFGISDRAFSEIWIAGATYDLRAILCDSLILLEDGSGLPDNGAASFVLLGTREYGTANVFAASRYGSRIGETFMDTLIIVSSQDRVRYAKPPLITNLPKAYDESDADSMQWRLTFTMNGKWQEPMLWFREADNIHWAPQDWAMLKIDHIDGASWRYQNMVFRMWNCSPQAPYSFMLAADTFYYNYIKSCGQDAFEIRRIPADSIAFTGAFWDTVLHDEITDWTVDSTAYENTYYYHYVIHNASTTDFHDWPIDTFDYIGVYVEDIVTRPQVKFPTFFPVRCTTFTGTPDSIKFIVTDVPYFDQIGTTEWWGNNDTLTLIRWNRNSTTWIDSSVVELWKDPCQAMVNSRMYYAGNPDEPSELWWLDEYTVDTAGNVAGNLYINRNDGDRITAIMGYSRNVLVCKRNQVYLVTISPYDNAPDEVVSLRAATGTPSQQTIVAHGNDIYYIGPPFGVFRVSGNVVANIAAPVAYYFSDSLRAGYEGNMRLFVYNDPIIGTPGLYVCMQTTEGNNVVLRYDLTTQAWTKEYRSMDAVAVIPNEQGFGDTLLFGWGYEQVDAEGSPQYTYIEKYPYGQRRWNGAEIDMHLSTVNASIGPALVNKTIYHYVPEMLCDSAGLFIFSFYADNGAMPAYVDTVRSTTGDWQWPTRNVRDVFGRTFKITVDTDSTDAAILTSIELYYRSEGGPDE